MLDEIMLADVIQVVREQDRHGCDCRGGLTNVSIDSLIIFCGTFIPPLGNYLACPVHVYTDILGIHMFREHVSNILLTVDFLDCQVAPHKLCPVPTIY